jgi:hypothetical protein
LLFLGALTLAAAQCLDWTFGAWIGWSAGEWLTPLWLAVALTVGAVVNALALIVFVMRRRGSGEQTLAVAQVGNILFSVVASLAVSPAWLLLDAAPALATLILVLMLQRGPHPGARRQSEI